jgi:hypothetical protein
VVVVIEDHIITIIDSKEMRIFIIDKIIMDIIIAINFIFLFVYSIAVIISHIKKEKKNQAKTF